MNPNLNPDQLESLIQAHQRQQQERLRDQVGVRLDEVCSRLGVTPEYVRQVLRDSGSPLAEEAEARPIVLDAPPPAPVVYQDVPNAPVRGNVALVVACCLALVACGTWLRMVWLETDPKRPEFIGNQVSVGSNKDRSSASQAQPYSQEDARGFVRELGEMRRDLEEGASAGVPDVQAKPPVIRAIPEVPAETTVESGSAPAEAPATEDGSGLPPSGAEPLPTEPSLPDGPTL